MSAQSRRVLIAMSDAGGGHRAVSRALAAALEERHGAETRIEDMLALDPRAYPHRMVRLYPWVMRNAPLLNGIAYHSTNRRRVYTALARPGVERLAPYAAELLRDWNPAVIITTHPFCNELMFGAMDRCEIQAPVVAGVTELVMVHVSWHHPRLDHYFVATDEAYAAMRRFGVEPDRLTRTGLPIDLRFGRVKESSWGIRRRLGLDPDRLTVLLVGGGEGAGGLAATARALDRSKLDLQLMVVCGRNQRLRSRLNQVIDRHPAAVLGFVDSMPQLMQAADVIVTKGGPTTIAEALVSGRPAVVTSILPGQEEGNDRFVERHAVGVGSLFPRSVVRAVARLARDAVSRQAMGERAGRLMPHGAAYRAADLVVDRAREAGRWLEAGTPLTRA